jgi:hypothetical protein
MKLIDHCALVLLPSWSRGGASTDILTGVPSVVAAISFSSWLCSFSSFATSRNDPFDSGVPPPSISREISTLLREVVVDISTGRSEVSAWITSDGRPPMTSSFLRLGTVGRALPSLSAIGGEVAATWMLPLGTAAAAAARLPADSEARCRPGIGVLQYFQGSSSLDNLGYFRSSSEAHSNNYFPSVT